MISRKSTFFLGIFIFLMPFAGFPSSWENIFIIISGIVLILLSLKLSLPKRPIKGRIRREKVNPVFVENIPVYPKDNTIESSLKSGTREKSNTQ